MNGMCAIGLIEIEQLNYNLLFEKIKTGARPVDGRLHDLCVCRFGRVRSG